MFEINQLGYIFIIVSTLEKKTHKNHIYDKTSVNVLRQKIAASVNFWKNRIVLRTQLKRANDKPLEFHARRSVLYLNVFEEA